MLLWRSLFHKAAGGWLGLAALTIAPFPAQKPRPPKPQPIPFSHKLHVALGRQCADCHEMPEPGDLATYPKEAKCMVCHAGVKTESPSIMALAAYFKRQKPVPWVQVYKVPDFVWFSHKKHDKKDGITCDTCHGAVAEREVIYKEKLTTMASCMECHDQMGASVACNACHNP